MWYSVYSVQSPSYIVRGVYVVLSTSPVFLPEWPILLCGLEKNIWIYQKKKKKVSWPTKFEPWFPFGTALGFAYFMYLRYLKFHEIGSGANAEHWNSGCSELMSSNRLVKFPSNYICSSFAESWINLGSSATTVAPGFVHLTGAFYPASCR